VSRREVLGQVDRLGAIGRRDIYLELVVVVGDERQPPAVGRIRRVIVEAARTARWTGSAITR
jgi:hypothetical protein